MPTGKDHDDATTGTVESFDAARGLGAIRPDDGTPPCTADADTLRACGIASLETGERVRFRVRVDGAGRTATDITLLRAVPRWENEGGALGPPK